MKYRISIATLVACTTLLATMLSTPITAALARSPIGALVFKDSYRFDYEGSTIHHDNMAVVNEAMTPSGNARFIANGSYKYSQTDPSGALTHQDTLAFHAQALTMDGLLEEMGQFYTYTIAIGGKRCTTKYAFRVENAQIKFERSTLCN